MVWQGDMDTFEDGTAQYLYRVPVCMSERDLVLSATPRIT